MEPSPRLALTSSLGNDFGGIFTHLERQLNHQQRHNSLSRQYCEVVTQFGLDTMIGTHTHTGDAVPAHYEAFGVEQILAMPL